MLIVIQTFCISHTFFEILNIKNKNIKLYKKKTTEKQRNTRDIPKADIEEIIFLNIFKINKKLNLFHSVQTFKTWNKIVMEEGEKQRVREGIFF